MGLMDLSIGQYYGYITLYVMLFMLDDLVIFGFAAFAIQKIVDTSYAVEPRGRRGDTWGIWMLTR